MPPNEGPWDRNILNEMKPGCVTFAWDDGEIVTTQAPEKTLDKMVTAWEWIDKRLKEYENDKGKPRSVCFRLTGGEFRGLRFPDWRPGMMDD